MSIDLGKKFLSQKNFKDAEKIFLDLNKNNNNFEINYNLAIIYFELKNIKKSLIFFDKCKKIDPKSLNTYLKVAYLEQSTGCLLYTYDAAEDTPSVDLGGRRIIK